MNETIETTVKSVKPKKKVIKSEIKKEKSAFAKLYGLLEGKVFYESDDIFYPYRFTTQ